MGYVSRTQGVQADSTKRSKTVGGPPTGSPFARAVEGPDASATARGSVSGRGIVLPHATSRGREARARTILPRLEPCRRRGAPWRAVGVPRAWSHGFSK